MTPMKRVMGRPSRGPRDVFTVKLSVGDGERVRELADRHNLSYQDLLEALVRRSLADVDVEVFRGQEALPNVRLAS